MSPDVPRCFKNPTVSLPVCVGDIQRDSTGSFVTWVTHPGRDGYRGFDSRPPGLPLFCLSAVLTSFPSSCSMPHVFLSLPLLSFTLYHLPYNRCPPPSLPPLPLLSHLASFDPLCGPSSAFLILLPANFHPSFLFLFPRISLTSPFIYLLIYSFSRTQLHPPRPAHFCHLQIEKTRGGRRKN